MSSTNGGIGRDPSGSHHFDDTLKSWKDREKAGEAPESRGRDSKIKAKTDQIKSRSLSPTKSPSESSVPKLQRTPKGNRQLRVKPATEGPGLSIAESSQAATSSAHAATSSASSSNAVHAPKTPLNERLRRLLGFVNEAYQGLSNQNLRPVIYLKLVNGQIDAIRCEREKVLDDDKLIAEAMKKGRGDIENKQGDKVTYIFDLYDISQELGHLELSAEELHNLQDLFKEELVQLKRNVVNLTIPPKHDLKVQLGSVFFRKQQDVIAKTLQIQSDALAVTHSKIRSAENAIQKINEALNPKVDAQIEQEVVTTVKQYDDNPLTWRDLDKGTFSIPTGKSYTDTILNKGRLSADYDDETILNTGSWGPQETRTVNYYPASNISIPEGSAIAASRPCDAEFAGRFMKMIFEQNSSHITRLNTSGEVAGEFEYLPQKIGEHKVYPGVSIELKNQEIVDLHGDISGQYAVIKTLEVTVGSGRRSRRVREVKVVEYKNWPDRGNPDLKAFHNFLTLNSQIEQQEHLKGYVGKEVIHCSSGVGRTATYFLAKKLPPNADFAQITSNMITLRKQRQQDMVQAPQQFGFIFAAKNTSPGQSLSEDAVKSLRGPNEQQRDFESVWRQDGEKASQFFEGVDSKIMDFIILSKTIHDRESLNFLVEKGIQTFEQFAGLVDLHHDFIQRNFGFGDLRADQIFHNHSEIVRAIVDEDSRIQEVVQEFHTILSNYRYENMEDNRAWRDTQSSKPPYQCFNMEAVRDMDYQQAYFNSLVASSGIPQAELGMGGVWGPNATRTVAYYPANDLKIPEGTAIAASAPANEEYASRFIKMLLEKNPSHVTKIMTNGESGGAHSFDYVPNTLGEERQYGNCKIKLLGQEHVSLSKDSPGEYALVKTVQITNEKGAIRNINIVAYVNWPDRGVPNAQSLQAFNDLTTRIAQTAKNNGYNGDEVIHCQSGVGRTGTYFLAKYLPDNEPITEKKLMDSITEIRRQRSHEMVQSSVQFAFLLLFKNMPSTRIHTDEINPVLASPSLARQQQAAEKESIGLFDYTWESYHRKNDRKDDPKVFVGLVKTFFKGVDKKILDFMSQTHTSHDYSSFNILLENDITTYADFEKLIKKEHRMIQSRFGLGNLTPYQIFHNHSEVVESLFEKEMQTAFKTSLRYDGYVDPVRTDPRSMETINAQWEVLKPNEIANTEKIKKRNRRPHFQENAEVKLGDEKKTVRIHKKESPAKSQKYAAEGEGVKAQLGLKNPVKAENVVLTQFQDALSKCTVGGTNVDEDLYIEIFQAAAQELIDSHLPLPEEKIAEIRFLFMDMVNARVTHTHASREELLSSTTVWGRQLEKLVQEKSQKMKWEHPKDDIKINRFRQDTASKLAGGFAFPEQALEIASNAFSLFIQNVHGSSQEGSPPSNRPTSSSSE